MSKGSHNRTRNRKAFQASYEAIFGHSEPRFAPGAYVMGRKGLRKARPGDIVDDDRPRRSMALGCPNPAQQKRRLAMYSKAGIRNCRYDPRTAELLFPPGLDNQKRIAALHGLEVD